MIGAWEGLVRALDRLRCWWWGVVVVTALCLTSGVAGCDSLHPRGLSPGEVRSSKDVRIGTAYRYEMYTHCGAREAKFAGEFWLAAPGSTTPPAWDDPDQNGTITRRSVNEAEFEAKGYLLLLLRRPGATTFLRLCA